MALTQKLGRGNNPELFEGVMNKQYDGYIKPCVMKVLTGLPPGSKSTFDELYQEFVEYAIEAVEMYDPYNARGAKFATFLTKHLNVRAHTELVYAWAKKRTNGKSIYSIGVGAGHTCSKARNPFLNAVCTEAFENVSDRSKETLRKLLNCDNYPLLLKRISKKWDTWVCNHAEITKEDWEKLKEELKIYAD